MKLHLRHTLTLLPLLLLLAIAPTSSAAQYFPLDNAAYLGGGLYVTSLREVVGETDYWQEDTGVPLYAQLWTYDADGVDDYGESVLGLYSCPGELGFVLVDEQAAECVPYDRTGADISLIYADRRFDLALLQTDPPADAAPLIIDATPVTSGDALQTPAEDLRLDSARVVNVDAITGEIIKNTPAADAAYQSARALVADRDVAESIRSGTPVTDSDGELRGFVIRSAGERAYVSPASEWIDDLHAANLQIQSPALTAALANAILPERFAGASSIGDSFSPELGNSGIDVLHYDLTLAADPTVPAIDGTASLSIAVTYPNLAEFTLDLRDIMTVTSVRVDGAPVEFEQSTHKLHISLEDSLAFGEEITVEIDYGGTLIPVESPYLPFFTIGVEIDPASPRFAMVTEPDTANTWFPGNDHPLDAATFDFHITVAQPFEAIANGTPSEAEGNADGTRTFHWTMPDPMTTYLALIAVADYQLIEDKAPNGIPLRHYIYNSHSVELATEAFSGTGLAMETLEGFFGPYPFDTYGHVLTPLRGSALETQTMSAMPFGLATSSERGAWDLIVHEMAHQWFGNTVRLGAWADIWLNEGFASYAEWLADEDRFGPDRHLESRRAAESFLAVGGRRTPLAYPEATELFGPHSYQKGAWVLHMLRVELGDDVFFPMIQEYALVFADYPVTTAAFFQFAERFAGRDLTNFRWQWLEQPQAPDFALYWTPTARGVDVRLCSQRPEQRYWFELPLEFSDNHGESAQLSLTLNADDLSEDEPQHMTASFALEFNPTDLQVDPFEVVLDGIQARQVSELPPCNES